MLRRLRILGLMAALAGVVLAALIAGPAEARVKHCGKVQAFGARLPVAVVKGSVTCSHARVLISNFIRHGKQFQGPWFCADDHGHALQQGKVAHCISPSGEGTPRKVVQAYAP